MGNATPGFAVSGANVSALTGELNTYYQMEGGRDPNIDLSSVLYVDRPGMGRNGGMISMDGIYPLSVLSWDDKEKGDTELRDFGEGGVVECGPIRAARRDGPSVAFPSRPDYDPYGLIMQSIPAMARWGKHLWAWLVARALMNGAGSADGKAYDKVDYFSASHLVNPLDTGGDTYSNVLTNTDIDDAGLAAAMDALGKIVDLNGKSLANAGMALPTVMVPTRNLWVKAARLLYPGGLIPNSAGTAPMTTVYAGMAALVYNPYLFSEASNKTTAAKTWFLISDAGRKPLIARETKAPQIVVTNEADWPKHQRDALLAYISAYCSVGYGEPRSIVKVTLP